MTSTAPTAGIGSAWHRFGDAVTPWRVLALIITPVVCALSVTPVRDVDVWWHILLGREIVSRRTIHGLGSEFTFGPADADWVTTQWLSEVIFAGLHELGGERAFVALTAVAAGALALSLAWLLLRGRRSPWAAVLYVMTLIIGFAHLQERPQLFSLFFTVWLSWTARRVLTSAAPPRLIPVIIVTAVWANLHGLWILSPAVLGLLAVGRLMEQQRMEARKLLALTLGASVAGCLTPVGPALLTSPVRFAGASAHLAEWQPTRFRDGITILFACLVAALIVTWARAATAVRHTEIFFALAIVAWSLMAMRNVPTAGILLAPLVCDRLVRTFPRADGVGNDRERATLRLVALSAVLALPVALAVRAGSLAPVSPKTPVSLAEELRRLPGVGHRVLNDYNTAGALLFWGGPETQLAIDGRADRYKSEYITQYFELFALRGQWEQLLQSLSPELAVVDESAPLRDELQRRGWSVQTEDGRYVLLRSPRAL